MMPSVKEPLAGLALLVILGFLIWYNRPLENARLLDPYLPDETAQFTAPGAYEAWLWQDPFGFDPDHGSGGAARAWALAAKGEKRDKNFSSTVPRGLTCKVSLKETLNLDKEKSEKIPERIVLAPLVKVAPHTLENKEMRTRQRYAVVAGLVESGYQPVEPGALHFCSIQENRRKEDGSEKNRSQMDHREYDMRWERYRHESHGKSGDDSIGGKPDIVVAWIDSRILIDESKFPAKHPCTKSCDFAFKNLLKNISKNNKLYLFDVGNVLDSERSRQIENHIGCIRDENASSTGTNGIKKEAKSGNDGKIKLIKLAGMEAKEKQDKCNAEANAEPSGQAGKEAQATCKEAADKPTEEPEQCSSKTREKTGSEKLGGQKTGGTAQYKGKETGSEKLARLLAKELTLRGITHPSQVMTISELKLNPENAATLGGSLREYLSRLLAGQERATESPAQEAAQPECADPTPDDTDGNASRRSDEIRNIFYLKGMDGKIAWNGDQYGKDKNHKDANGGDGRDRDKSGQTEKDKKIPSIELRHSPPLSVGASQLDYFHRLAEEMNNAHHVVDIDKRDSGVRAVVILGSDFHDKLLIIQALREKMPHLLILTTDLDAQMLDPKHWRATRNLVVASHFDLRLREKPAYDKPFSQWASQGQFPPFRDNQQTNIFYRTLSIGKDNAESIAESKETFPRIFEVGRNGFVRLGSVEKDNNPDYHPPDDIRENTAKELGLLLGIAVSLIIFHRAIRPWSTLYSGYLFFGTSIIFALAFGFGTDVFSNNELKEPFSFTDSVSLWPSLFIQIIVILLACRFIVQVMFELDTSSCRLRVRYFSSHPSSFSLCPYEFESWTKRQCRRWRFFRPLLRRIKERNLREWLTVLFLILTIIAYAANDVYPSEFPFWWCLGLLLWIVAIVYMPHTWNSVSIDQKRWFFVLIGMVIIYVLMRVYPLESPYWSNYFDLLRNHFSLFAHVITPEFPFWLYLGLLFWAAAIAYLLSSWKHVSKRKKIFLSAVIWTIIAYVLISIYPLEFPFSLYFGFLLLLGATIVYLPRSWNTVSIKQWMQDNCWHPSGQVNPERSLWWQYHGRGRFYPRSTRVMAMWLIFSIIETLLVYLLPPWPLPWRGASDTANWSDVIYLAPWIGVLSFTATMLLLFFVLDAVRLNFYWIKKLRTQHPLFTGCIPGGLDYLSVPRRLARLENIVMLVAARTQAVDRLIYYPMFCIMLMLLAKITYFDNQEFPLSKGITFAAAISFLFFSGFVLRHEANELRNCVKKSLHDLRVSNATPGIDETISRIDAIDEGAFQPMLEQPVMQALLIMLASVGLFAGEYLKVFG